MLVGDCFSTNQYAYVIIIRRLQIYTRKRFEEQILIVLGFFYLFHDGDAYHIEFS